MSADRRVFDDCWFCGRRTYMGKLIAGYDTFDEQRLACDDCDRTLKAMARRGYFFQRPQPDPDPRHYETEPPPPSRPRGVVVIALCVFAALALGIAVAVWALWRS